MNFHKIAASLSLFLPFALSGCALLFNPASDSLSDGTGTNNQTGDENITLSISDPAEDEEIESNYVSYSGVCTPGVPLTVTPGTDVTIDYSECTDAGILRIGVNLSGYTDDRTITATQGSESVTRTIFMKTCNTTYYIDATLGGDGNTGTAPGAGNAWKTFSNPNGVVAMNPGDCILLKRGEVWREALDLWDAGTGGTANNHVRIGAYGSGRNPVINGSDVITGFAAAGSEFSVAGIGSPSGVLFNGDFLTLGAGIGALNAGEYYVDAAGGGTLYVKDNPLPVEYTVEAIYRYGFGSNAQNYMMVEDLEIINTSRGILENGGTAVEGLLIQDNIIHDSNTGILLGAANSTIRRNTVYEVSEGIWADESDITIEDNYIYNTWYGNRIGIVVFEPNTTVQRNLVHSGNNAGIQVGFNGGGNIRQNIIANIGGFGIYVSPNTSQTLNIDNNSIFDVTTGVALNSTFGPYVIRNNILSNDKAGGEGLLISPGVGLYTESHNLYYASGGGDSINDGGFAYGASQAQVDAFQTANPGTSEGGSVYADPLIAGSANGESMESYRLTSTSPAIGGGTDVGLSSDYEGNTIDSSPDIGALEYQEVPACDAVGTCYYVDATAGSDGNTGTSPDQAWQSNGKVSAPSLTYQPGDKILYKRGEYFLSGIYTQDAGTAANPITYGAYYGSGKLPTIDGAYYTTGGFSGPDINGEYSVVGTITRDPGIVTVDGVIWTGNDGGSGGGLAPGEWDWTSAGGGTLFFKDNVNSSSIAIGYREPITVQIGDNNLVFENLNIARAVYDGSGYAFGCFADDIVVQNSEFTQNAFYSLEALAGCDNILVQNNSFVNAPNAWGVRVRNTGSQITGNSFTNLSFGIDFGSASDVTIENNSFRKMQYFGVSAQAAIGSGPINIDNNVFIGDTTDNFIYMVGAGVLGSNEVNIRHNSMNGSDSGAIVISDATANDINIFNNIVYDASSSALDFNIVSFTENYNIFGNSGGDLIRVTGAPGTPYGSADFATYQTDTSQGANSAVTSPNYVSATPFTPHDLRIQSGSPAENAADLTFDGIDDFEGNPRDDGAPDIGAFER